MTYKNIDNWYLIEGWKQNGNVSDFIFSAESDLDDEQNQVIGGVSEFDVF